MRNKTLAAAALLAVLAVTGCGGNPTSSSVSSSIPTTSSSEEPQLEGTLNLIAGCEEPYMNAVADAFSKKYGVTVNAIRKSSGEIQTQVENENGSPSADVVFGGTTDPYNALKAEGLLYQYTSVNDGKISDARFKDSDHYWYGIYKGILGFMYNKEKVTSLGLDIPQTWDDLIKPEYRSNTGTGYVTWSHPQTAGTAKLVLNTIVQKKANGAKTTYKDKDGVDMTCYDDTAAMNYFAALDANTAQYTKSGSGASKQVGTGDCIIGIGFLHDVIYQIVDNDYTTIGMVAPTDGTAFEVGATAMLKGCAHPNLAKKFIDFALTEDCVGLGQKNGSYQFLVIDGAKQPQAAIDAGLQQVNVMNYDFDDAKVNIGHYVDDWMTKVNVAAPKA